MDISYSPQARKALRKMQPKTARRILDAMELIGADPERRDLDIKPLQGRGGYRLRIGDWRVIYDIAGLVIAVERIGPRGDVYR